MVHVYKNIEEYNRNNKRKMLIAFDDMIADMLSNKKLNPIVTELLFRGRKLNISLVFSTQSNFAILTNIRLNSTFHHENSNQTGASTNLHSIIHQILTFKTLLIFTKNVLQNHIHFWLLIIRLHQIILLVSERIL